MSKTDDMRKAREASQPRRVRVPLPPRGALDSIMGDELSFSGSPEVEAEIAALAEPANEAPMELKDLVAGPGLHFKPERIEGESPAYTWKAEPSSWDRYPVGPTATEPATTETVLRSATRKHRKPKLVGTQHLGIRCSPDELERWQARADAEGRSLSNWARRMLNNG